MKRDKHIKRIELDEPEERRSNLYPALAAGFVIWWAVFIAMAMLRCTPEGYKPPKPKGHPTEACLPACSHLQALGCDIGGEMRGETCVQWCVRTHRAGHNLMLGCWLVAESCEEVERCR